jgi:transglutaminase-like putative cysteine protease
MPPPDAAEPTRQAPAAAPPPHRRPTPADAPSFYLVRRRLRVSHSLDYRYPHPVRDVLTRLRLFPPASRGWQRLVAARERWAPPPTASSRFADAHGNAVIELRHEKVWEHLTLVVDFEIENAALYAPDHRVVPQPVPAAEHDAGAATPPPDRFLEATPLTAPDDALERCAWEPWAAAPGPPDEPLDLAFALCRAVFQAMHYAPGTTTVQTAAAAAWAQKRGVCQDYAHVLLALCRSRGLPARYVSGFLPGEGAMHAWVEVYAPPPPGHNESAFPRDAAVVGDARRRGGGWFGLDPTHDRWTNERYVAVAVGRDYADISPASGTFLGPGPGTLKHRSRVLVEKTTRTPAP